MGLTVDRARDPSWAKSHGGRVESYRICCRLYARSRLQKLCRTRARAFDEKVESLIADSHDGANRIQDPHWNKGASHEWGSLIPPICPTLSFRQSKPVIPARHLLTPTP